MSIDEKAVEAAVRAYLDHDGDGADIWGRCGAAMRKAIEAYEAAKTAEQPVGLSKKIGILDARPLENAIPAYVSVAPMREVIEEKIVKHDAMPLGEVWVHNPDKPKPLTREELLAKYSEQELHDQFMHPDYEYETVETGRKDRQDGRPGDDWEPNNCVYAGWGENKHRRNWERYDYTEDNYWMRKRTQIEVEKT